MTPPFRVIALVTAFSSASASAASPAPAPAASAAEPESTPDPNTEAEPPATWVEPGPDAKPKPEAVSPPPPPAVDPANHRLVVAGNVITGVGLGAFIMMTTGFLVASDARDRLGFANAREDEDEIAKQEGRARAGNIVGITGAAAMGAFLITGLTLIGVGRARERKRRAALESHRLSPLVGPSTAGVQWVTRF